MNITKKIILTAIIPLLLLGVLSLGASILSMTKLGEEEIKNQTKMLEKEKENKLRDLVRNTMAILDSQYKAANDPEQVAAAYLPELKGVIETAVSGLEAIYARDDIDEAGKKSLALAMVSNMRYADGGYIWINDATPRMVMHPIKPSLDGTDLSTFKDPKGKKLFVEMATVCKKHGEGTVDYMWPKPGHDEPVKKLSYVKLFEPWGWILGTGVYLERAEKSFKEEAKRGIAALRYGAEGKDYFFVIDQKTKMVMHPLKPSLV